MLKILQLQGLVDKMSACLPDRLAQKLTFEKKLTFENLTFRNFDILKFWHFENWHLKKNWHLKIWHFEILTFWKFDILKIDIWKKALIFVSKKSRKHTTYFFYLKIRRFVNPFVYYDSGRNVQWRRVAFWKVWLQNIVIYLLYLHERKSIFNRITRNGPLFSCQSQLRDASISN